MNGGMSFSPEPETRLSQNQSKFPGPVVILGAGLTGLSTAYHIKGKPTLLVERGEEVGGHARSERWNGHTFDVTGHWLHLRDPRVQALVAERFRPGDLIEIERRASVLFHGTLVD